ncbi:MAG: hypothetical protein CBC25_04500 [Pelagibacteraceae bacterium TMED65]|nr:MAG: hypothetical protein CBC25_04500 [Pelagibacteraceae bacterium TMED65]
MAKDSEINRLLYRDWFVAQHKPNFHKIAKHNLERQGLKTFLPLFESTKIKANRYITELKPLFTGYIFVSFDRQGQEWANIKYTTGITRLIVVNNIPQKIPNEFITSLIKRCDMDEKLISEPDLKPGIRVEVTQGPLTNLIGTIENVSPEKRVTILFELMGRETKTMVENKDVKLIH